MDKEPEKIFSLKSQTTAGQPVFIDYHTPINHTDLLAAYAKRLRSSEMERQPNK